MGRTTPVCKGVVDTYPTIQSEVIVLIPIGVILFGGVLIIILRRFGRDDEFGYRIPQLGAWGVGQESPSQALSDAEHYVEREIEVE